MLKEMSIGRKVLFCVAILRMLHKLSVRNITIIVKAVGESYIQKLIDKFQAALDQLKDQDDEL